MANSVDPDQLAYLDLHCLQMQGISGFSRTRVKNMENLPGVCSPVNTESMDSVDHGIY